MHMRVEYGSGSKRKVVVGVVMWLLWWEISESQVTNPLPKPARDLDATLQEYAYRAFVNPRTGVPFDGLVPPYLNGIEISAMRLRSGSLYRRGIRTFKEFVIPVGLREQPYVERLVLVYQNLGNRSTTYYSLPGYIYLAPVLGLLAYNGTNLSASNLPQLDFWASQDAITLNFGRISPIPVGSVVKCAWFDLHGQVNFTHMLPGNVCTTTEQGHFSIVAAPPVQVPPAPPEPEPAPRGRRHSSRKNIEARVWGIIGAATGGIALLVLLALLILWVWRYKKRKRLCELERAADAGEALRMTRIGSTRAPFALATRTMPNFESDFDA